ncbi:hypothetical protein KK083_21760 [Fulvivirgaceae bacterium PWU4]|uniref:DUF502 domain-containing protein n=1 Tax=Chryseosolibacter histidini TaxID=2782349 RepID=A0AAP2DNC9_9BACT|nr:hypothetical protein [Chryseosolibacter histidini]MBT1699540.1 hypothetical protein [Chryseosolibacter histidini]
MKMQTRNIQAFAFFKRTVMSGVFLLLPILIIAVLFAKIWAPITKLVERISYRLNAEFLPGLNGVTILALCAILLLCFALGLLARLAFVSAFSDWVENNIIKVLPAYRYFKIIALEKMGVAHHEDQVCLLVYVQGTWQPALLIEDGPGTWHTVFVPLAPSPNIGTIHFVQAKHVIKTDHTLNDFHEFIQRFGKGIISKAEIQLPETMD